MTAQSNQLAYKDIRRYVCERFLAGASETINFLNLDDSFTTSPAKTHKYRRRKAYNIGGAGGCSSWKTDRAELGRLLGGSGGMLPPKNFEF